MKLKTTPTEEGFPIIVGDASITVNPMSASAMSRLRQKHTTIKRGVEQVKGSAMTKEMFDKVVLSWGPIKNEEGDPIPGSGINDEEGKPIPCTSENKRAVYEHNPDFAAEVLKEMEEVSKERRLGEEGN